MSERPDRTIKIEYYAGAGNRRLRWKKMAEHFARKARARRIKRWTA